MSESHTDEDRLQLTAERYETILRTIRDGVYTLDRTGRITWVNDVAVTDFNLGYSRDELIGIHVTDLLSEEDLKTCRSIIGDLLASDDRQSGRCEVELQTAYGTKMPVELHLALLPAPSGEFRGTVGVVRDVTRRKQREEWVQVLNRLFRHNLRNQMNVISGHTEILESRIDSEAHLHVEAINDSIQELVRLSRKTVEVQDTLMGAEETCETVDAAKLVTTVCQEYRQETPAVDLSLDVPDAAWVRADRSLEIVIENLLENAIEHSEDEISTIDVSVSPRTNEDKNWIEIRVADDGPGIPPVEVNAVTSGNVTPLRHGTGLGLWVVKWLVERYNGDIIFRDRKPRGSVVTIRLQPADVAVEE